MPRSCPVEEGEQVWLEGRHLKTHHPTTKLAPCCYGPFKVATKLSPVTYHLTLPPSMKIHPVFHINLLTLSRFQGTVARSERLVVLQCPTFSHRRQSRSQRPSVPLYSSDGLVSFALLRLILGHFIGSKFLRCLFSSRRLYTLQRSQRVPSRKKVQLIST
jgi:hypothetical protein